MKKFYCIAAGTCLSFILFLKVDLHTVAFEIDTKDSIAIEEEVVEVKIVEEPPQEIEEVYEENYVYTAVNVNARTGPDIKYDEALVLSAGTQVLRVSEEKTGYDGIIVNDEKLFIKHEYLTTERPMESLGKYTLTAYCACARCCGKSNGITASGIKATQGRTVACNFLPFGSEIIINGHTYIVEDRGGQVALKNKIDIYFDSHEEALKFGKQKAEVFLLK